MDSSASKQANFDAQNIGFVADCDTKIVAPTSYDGGIEDCVPGILEMQKSRITEDSMRKIRKETADDMGEATRINNICLRAAKVWHS